MRRLLSLLSVLSVSLWAAPGALAQHVHTERTCGTPTPTVQEVLESVAQVERWVAANPGLAQRGGDSFVTIPVAMHIVSSGDLPSQGNVPEQWITDQMDVLNAAYESMGLRFVIAFQQRVVNADWANLSQGGADEFAMKQALHLDVARYLNMYFVPNITSPQGSLLGFATFPDASAETSYRQGAVNITGSMPGGNSPPYNEGDTTVHEVGHYVGLYHTFQGGCSASPSGGDGVPDTPAEATAAFGCPTGRDSCPNLPGLDPITNYMDYVDDFCMFEFTPGQRTRSLALMNQFRPTIMNQTGLLAASPALAFDEFYVGQTGTLMVRIVNLSDEPVTLTSFTSTSGAFSVALPAEPIPAGGAVEVEVLFTPTEAGSVAGTLTIQTSDATTPTVVLTASGSAALPASAALAPQAFWESVPVGATATATLTLGNAGPAVLDYQISGGARVFAPALPLVAEAGAAARDGGGPDAFGYRWADSREAGGPVYDWVDISATGTAVTLPQSNSLVSVPLPFTFPYYGASRTSVNIVSNGFLSFSGTSTFAVNQRVPSTVVPNDIVAAFWENLNPTLGGEVRHQDMGDGRFVVSWLGIPPAVGEGAYTFQVVLYDDGRIRVQYQTMAGLLTSATVGIENATGTDGLEVAYNEPYVADGLAVEFFTLPTWLSLSPTSGTVAVGASEEITLTMDATDLRAGSYQSLIDIMTNDPLLPQPARLHAVLSVGGTLAPPALAQPRYGAEAVEPAPMLQWVAAENAASYEWQVATDASFDDVVASGTETGTSASASLSGGTAYFWRVRSIDGVLPSAWTLPFAFSTSGSVADEPGAAPTLAALGAPFPNPTRGALTVPFSLAEADASVSVRVLDVTGRVVATLADGRAFGAGEHRLAWDASRLSAGVYLVQMQTSAGVQSTRLTVTR